MKLKDLEPFYLNYRKFINIIRTVSIATVQYHIVLQRLILPGDWGQVRQEKIVKLLKKPSIEKTE